MIRRLLLVLPLALAFAGLVGTAAHAGGEPEPPDSCFAETGPNGELPTCEYDGREWTVSYEDAPFGPGGDLGVPSDNMGGFVAFAVIAVLIGVAGTIWRVSLARQMARESGLDPGRATAMTLMSDDGLDATYLASSLRTASDGDASSPARAREPRVAQERLRELQQLRDEGLISAEEYERRRTAIIDSI